MLRHLERNADAVVVHIGHERNRASLRPQAGADLGHRLGVGHRRGRDANDLATGISQTTNAGNSGGDVKRVLIDHRLDHNGVITANGNLPHHHRAGGTSVDLRVVPAGGGIDGGRRHGSQGIGAPNAGSHWHNRLLT